MQRRNQLHTPQSSDQAQEVIDSLPEHSSPLPASESEGEDLIEDAEEDYVAIPELDRYEDEGVDQEQHALNPEDRRAAEKALRGREREVGGSEEIEEYLSVDEEQEREMQRMRRTFYEVDEQGEQEQIELVDAEDQKGGFAVWVTNSSVRKYIKRRLIKFITQFRQPESGRAVYLQRLKEMCADNRQSLYVEFGHLKAASPMLALWLALHPADVLPEYNAVLYVLACRTSKHYEQLLPEAFLRVNGMPSLDSIRTLSYGLLGRLISIRGVVTSCSQVYSKRWSVSYKCTRCGYAKGPFFPRQGQKLQLGTCHSCHGNGPFKINDARCIYRNHQMIQLQQSPNDVAPGRIPRGKEVVLSGDLIDLVKPGDDVVVNGVFSTRYHYTLNIKQGFPVFQTLVEANSIQQLQKNRRHTEIAESLLESFPKSCPDFAKRFYNSIAPSIFGHYKVKRAITLALFGGVQQFNEKRVHRTRGDINVLLLGDPGIAKSQFLKSVQKVFPRAIYTTGKGASAVGLTASVRQDPQSGEWRLEAGALVLADKGVCLIDEFDKMSEQDRTSIHEAMEQQTISISKAGIVAQLNARCSVIAAANPMGGTYNEQVSFKDNTQLSAPILSRFDVLSVIKDVACSQTDGRLARFVINQHMGNHPYCQQFEMEGLEMRRVQPEELLEQPAEFIQEYIRYAREKCRPKLSSRCSARIKEFYMRLRQFSIQANGIDIVVRHLESMIRLAEAHARMHLRRETIEADSRVAIQTMLESFVDTQRHSTAQRILKAFRHELYTE